MRTLILFIVMMSVLVTSSMAAKKEWEQLKGDNFIIYYRQVPEDFVKTVLNSAESEFKTITANLGVTRYQGWRWEDRAKIYIYQDQEDYQVNGKQMGWSHGVAVAETKTIETFPSAHGFFDSTLPHELGHIIFREYVGMNADIPLWFEEGIAMYQEKAKRLGVEKLVKEAIKKEQFIPLSELSNMRLYSDTPIEVVELFYAQSASIIYFMINELGEAHFYKLLKELKENTRFDRALEKVYMRIKNTEDLNKKWLTYLRQ